MAGFRRAGHILATSIWDVHMSPTTLMHVHAHVHTVPYAALACYHIDFYLHGIYIFIFI